MDRGRRQRGRRTRARRGQAPRDRTARLDAHGGICRVSGTWGRQNIIVFSQLPRGGLQKVEAAGGPCEPFTTLASGETGHQHPEFLPDGQQVMYVVERDGTREIVVRSIASGKTTSLGPSESSALYAAGHLFFARAATLVAQPFDAVTLRRTGEPSIVASQVGVNPSGRLLAAVSDRVLVHAPGARLSCPT